MHDYLVRPEVARVALVIGVVVSVLFYERVQLTTGGAIVPAYLALFLFEPVYVVSTMVSAYLTYLLVNKLLSRRWILYGRRKFELEVLIGLTLVILATLIAHTWGASRPELLGITGIGMLIPGIIAHDMFRQTPRTTLVAVLATTAIVALAIFLFASLLEIAPLQESPMPLVGDETGYPLDLLLAGAAASVLAGMVSFSRLGLRSGGLISAAYLGLFVVRPLDLVFTAALALVTWWVVTRYLIPNLLIFGRRKMAAMLMVGAILTWPTETVIASATNGAYQPWKGFVLMSLMIPALLANDAQRQGVERTAWGAAISTAAVYGTVNLVAALLVVTRLA